MPIPVFPASRAGLVISQVNTTWGKVGAGSPEFWGKLGNALIYRDTTATSAPPCVLQYKEGFYQFVAVAGMEFSVKGRFERWSISEDQGVIMVGPVLAERIDGPTVPMELAADEDPTGMIRQIIQEHMRSWVEFLPLKHFTRMLVNGRVDTKHAAATCYDGLALFSATHKVNPLAKKGKAAGVINNLVQLTGAVDEAGWARCKDTLYRFPDETGERLPNSDGMNRPLLLCPSEQVFIRWAHFLGGANLPKELIQQGLAAGIHSVSVGTADLMVWPYLVTEAEAGLGFDPEKRTYMFSRNGRKPFIWREVETPFVKNTGPTGQPAHEQQADVIYSRAKAAMALGEYRSVIAIDEP